MENKINFGDKENYNFEKEFAKIPDPEIKVSVEKFFNELHSRDYSILTAALMEVILARNGFSKNERDAAVLTAACHDIAMPAGGNLTQEIDYFN